MLAGDADFPRAAVLREGIVALPVHQELGIRDLERIVDITLDGLGSTHAPSCAAPRSGQRLNICSGAPLT